MKIPIINNQLVYPCGCKFDIVGENPLRINFDPSPSSLPPKCSLTWDILAGNTKGIFQLETRLGQKAAKDLMPENMEQLAALTSILRPGCMNAKYNDKTVTQHYIDRKNNVEPVEYYHPDLVTILEDTYGEMIYQESAMQIATFFAGFDLKQADTLRKSIGKKKPELMAKLKIEFLDGCKRVGILNEEQASEVFGQIEKSQRYSFNKSHAISYGLISYMTAYQKAHFPVSFFVSYLYYAKDKQKKFDEVKLLVNNARIMDVDIRPPDFRYIHPHFKRIPYQQHQNEFDTISDVIYFGFGDIKGIGHNKVNTILSATYQIEQSLGKGKKDWSWLEFLLYFTPLVDTTITTAIIESGGLDYLKISRIKMLYEYDIYSKLTDKEQAWFQQKYAIYKSSMDSLLDIISYGIKIQDFRQKATKKELATLDKGPCATKNRLSNMKEYESLLIKPPKALVDDPSWIGSIEESRLGISLTTKVTDNCMNVNLANCSCLEFATNKVHQRLFLIPCQIEAIKTHLTSKKNEEMAFIEFGDGEATISGVIFPDKWEGIKKDNICVEGNIVMVSGTKSRKNDGLIIEKISQLT